ncbi:MAG: hypothetical protein WCA10_01560 [Terracidiphilus sp.]
MSFPWPAYEPPCSSGAASCSLFQRRSPLRDDEVVDGKITLLDVELQAEAIFEDPAKKQVGLQMALFTIQTVECRRGLGVHLGLYIEVLGAHPIGQAYELII